MPKQSAGILLFRKVNGVLEVLLVHPGGPFWKNKDAGAWTIPKGEIMPGEDHLTAARREFREETGLAVDGAFLPLGSIRQAGGKEVFAFALEHEADPDAIRSNTFEMEWPPRSGRRQRFPEVDRAAWFDLETAAAKILKGQRPLLERLLEKIPG